MKAELITHMGDDLLVVNAARVSVGKASNYESEALCPTDEQGGKIPPYNRLKEQDKRLLNYLAKHNHWTPFSHPHICMRETVPIFVARQRFKHMVGFTYNEVSRRYVDDEPEFYDLYPLRNRPDGSVKQGSGSTIGMDGQTALCSLIDSLNAKSLLTYSYLLESNVAPEQARAVLPQSMYTSYYVTGSLAAWARAYKQRIDAHAQGEIQDLAKQWDELIKPLFPESWKVLTS